MRRVGLPIAVIVVAVAALALAACGGTGSAPASSSASSSPAPVVAPSSTNGQGAGALTAEAASAATGDIPDNQVFLTLRNSAAGYSMEYPEGWAQRGSGNAVILSDKNNIVRIVVRVGALPTVSEVSAEMGALTSGGKPVAAGEPHQVTLNGAAVIEVTYQTTSAPNPVTGKSVVLVVDRYYLARGGKLAIVDLGTPQGVDNADAYRLMITSFTWR